MRGRGRAGRGVHGQRRNQLSNEIRATLVDHVINHGLHEHACMFVCFFSIFLFIPIYVNISAVHMLHCSVWGKIKCFNSMCVSGNISVHMNNLKNFLQVELF